MKLFALLIRRLLKKQKVYLQEPFMILQERVPLRAIYKGFYLEPLNFPAER